MYGKGTRRALFSGALESGQLPQKLDLADLHEGMDKLWQQSIAHLENGVVLEYAATIVLTAEDTLKFINEVRGDSSEVTPDLNVSARETFVGTFHTHPRVDGLVPMPFSPSDFVSAVLLRENISVMRSEETVLALVRTQRTVASIDAEEAQREFYEVFQSEVFLSGRILDAVWKANLALCERYGFALYVGRSDEPLKEVYRP